MLHMTKFLSTLAAVGAVAFAAAPSLAANKTVKVDDDFFSAKTVTIKKGNTVTWKWVGSNPHNVQFSKKVKSKTITKGTYKRTFKKRGTFKYVCIIHSGMDGKVIVK
jgi:plastocyanin